MGYNLNFGKKIVNKTVEEINNMTIEEMKIKIFEYEISFSGAAEKYFEENKTKILEKLKHKNTEGH